MSERHVRRYRLHQSEQNQVLAELNDRTTIRADRHLTWFMVVLFGGITLTYLGYGFTTVGAEQMATNLGKLVDDLMVPVLTGIWLGVTVGLLMDRMSDRR
jgi:hypothetical protein